MFIPIRKYTFNTVNRKSLYQIFGLNIGDNRVFRILFTIIFFLWFASYVSAEEILVGGTLAEDEIWTNENVYVVYKDLRIPAGITLTIQSGVTVKVDQGRGILVLGGNLMVNGRQNNEIDSVNFLPNHVELRDGWKWKGISYTGVSGSELNKISYANITDAEIAIDIYNSQQVRIENTCILNNQNIGARLYNSKDCSIIDCLLQDNYDGIEIVATNGSEASGNFVKGCILKNSNHNLYLLKAYGGIFINNLVENNLIEGGNNGIWMDDGGGEAYGRNTISKNILINNGAGEGFAILLAQDSIDITNNIFWKNHMALFYDPYTSGSHVSNNSFYQNQYGITLSTGSEGNEFLNNTFSSNEVTIFDMRESGDFVFSATNIFPMPEQENIIINKTQNDVDLDNNYWHVASDEYIPKLIYDKNDDPILGVIYYEPVLSEADTTNPVSPPFRVIKQLVDGDVKISWFSNPEKDQKSYKVYFGGFENYSFQNALSAGIDTSFLLSGVDISDSIAVTALDSTLMLTDAQVNGHESPFAFALPYPYAGDDVTICKNQDAVQIMGGTVPYSYLSISWFTSGDGYFDDSNILSPVYFTGETDKQEGKVVLTMGVSAMGGIKLYDSLTLNIYDDPVAFAGNDTTIFADAQLDLTSAFSQYYESIHWVTTGDGVFNNDTLQNPVYSPGDMDIELGEVELVLMAVSECGMASDTLRLLIEPFFAMQGKLWYKGQLVQHGVVIAVKDSEEGTRAVEMEQTADDGTFIFSRMMEGRYYIYAVPDTILTNGAVPGYYANNLRWQNAHYFKVDADIFDVDIMLPAVDYQLPVGEGSISGSFEMPAINMFTEDIYCNSWFEPNSSRDFCDGGLSNITVLLYNSNGTKLLDYTLTDELGNFYFNNLPYGGYIIDAEKAGYQTSVSSLITLSPQHMEETGVILELSNEKIGIYRTDDPAKHPIAKVYPNPATDKLYLISPFELDPSAYVDIYNVYGQLVLTTAAVQSSQPDSWQVNVSTLPAGMYVGKWHGPQGNAHFTFIKN